MMTELKKHSKIVGDLSILQSRQKIIRDLSDTRTKENARFESVVDLGEKLYAHTSPEGRETIRQQLRNLRTLWDGFSEDLQLATQKLDQCLMQFAEFSFSQEQLTSWLRDVERAMHQHTELKSTLEEKRAQLQNHKIMHQEIMSHQSLVESVCDKAQKLVNQTQDTSLNVYLQSIKQLFHNIVSKSRDLLENLEDCAEKHNRFNVQCKEFYEWFNIEKQKLVDCNNSKGERSDIAARLNTLQSLKQAQIQGREYLDKIKETSASVVKSTAEKGRETIAKEVKTLESCLNQHIDDIGRYCKVFNVPELFSYLLCIPESTKTKQKVMLDKWEEFEKQMESLSKWFSAMEATFKDQQLQPNLAHKIARLKFLKEQREDIVQKEEDIDQFVDKSHALLNATGVERIRPLITQISNR